MADKEQKMKIEIGYSCGEKIQSRKYEPAEIVYSARKVVSVASTKELDEKYAELEAYLESKLKKKLDILRSEAGFAD